jgi:hypothetical protein
MSGKAWGQTILISLLAIVWVGCITNTLSLGLFSGVAVLSLGFIVDEVIARVRKE